MLNLRKFSKLLVDKIAFFAPYIYESNFSNKCKALGFTVSLDRQKPELEVPSPCRQVCRLDEQEVCTGCGRTLDEIARWTQMSDQQKFAVWERLGRPIE